MKGNTQVRVSQSYQHPTQPRACQGRSDRRGNSLLGKNKAPQITKSCIHLERLQLGSKGQNSHDNLWVPFLQCSLGPPELHGSWGY